MIKKLIYFVLLISIGVGAYFFGFNNDREKEILKKAAITASSDSSSTNKVSDKNTASNKPVANKPTENNLQTVPADGSQEYTVAENDTLFTIGLKFDILWTHIAKANGIDENTPLFIGQKLKIPSNESDQATTQNEDTQILEINLTDAQAEQSKVNSDGTDSWRRDAVEVARREAPTSFNLAPGDPYSLVATDVQKGTATVFLQKDEKSYTFSLIQPVDKGENGIWKIEKIVINKNT